MRSVSVLAVAIALCIAIPTFSYGADKYKDLYSFGEDDDPIYKIASSGSLRPSSFRTFTADNAFDGDSNTSWCTKGGVGNWISVEFANVRYVEAINFIAGGSGELFYQNNRPQKIRITLSDGTAIPYTFEQDNRRPHTIKVDADTKSILVTVEYIISGRMNDNLCISEIGIISSDAER